MQKILVGEEIIENLTQDEIKKYSKTISELILSHHEIMKPFSGEQIYNYIMSSQSVLALDGDILLGYCKFMVHPSVDERTKEVVEVGSLIITKEARGKGLGFKLTLETLELAKKVHSKLKIISVVSISNIASIKILEKLKAKKIDMPSNVPHMIPGVKHIYQLSDIALDYKALIRISKRNVDSAVSIVKRKVRKRLSLS